MANHPMQGRAGDGGGQQTPPQGGKGAQVADDVRSEQQEGAAKAAVARRFPAGEAAVKDLRDDESVELVNVSLKDYRHVTWTGGKGQFRKVDTIRPFGTFTVKVPEARRLLAESPKRPRYLFVVPPAGDCGGADTFDAFGERWATCPFRDCPRHPAPFEGARHSVMMVQHLIASRETEPAIRYIAERLDPREAVVRWAFKIIDVRQRRRLQRNSLVGTGDVGGTERQRRPAVF
jgi:hypothetical protein